jgi:hypothetical protein
MAAAGKGVECGWWLAIVGNDGGDGNSEGNSDGDGDGKRLGAAVAQSLQNKG